MSQLQGNDQGSTVNLQVKWFQATARTYDYEVDQRRDLSSGDCLFVVRATSAEEAKSLIEASPEFQDPLVGSLSAVVEVSGNSIDGFAANLDEVEGNFLVLVTTEV